MRDGNVADPQQVLICSNCFECNEKPIKVAHGLSEQSKSNDSENDFSFRISMSRELIEIPASNKRSDKLFVPLPVIFIVNAINLNQSKILC